MAVKSLPTLISAERAGDSRTRMGNEADLCEGQ